MTFHAAHIYPFVSDLDFLTSRHLTLHFEYEKKPENTKQSLKLTTHATFGYAVVPMRPVTAPSTCLNPPPVPAPTTSVAAAAAAVSKDSKTGAPLPAPSPTSATGSGSGSDAKSPSNQSPMASVAAAAAAAARIKEQTPTTSTATTSSTSTGGSALQQHSAASAAYQFRIPVLREGQIVGWFVGSAVVRYRPAPPDFKDVYVSEKAPY